MVKSTLAFTALALLGTGSIRAADDAVKPWTMERAVEWNMTSPYGTRYRIMVSAPAGEAPAQGYPVLYVLDGDEMFPAVTAILRLQAGTPKLEKHNGISPGSVVGIGYADQSARDVDYTPPAEKTGRPETYRDGRPYRPRPEGGADRFHEFLETAVKPAVEEKFAVDRKRQTLMGNGYGGLFALHSLFTRPGSYQAYVAASPSIWWNGQYILREEKEFAGGPEPVRLLLTVGEGEQSLSKTEFAWPEDEREEHRLKITRRAMVDSTRELFWRLEQREFPGFEVAFASFPAESHKSAAPLSICRALPFVFPAKPSP